KADGRPQMTNSRRVDAMIARMDEVVGRIDRTAASREAQFRALSRSSSAVARRIATVVVALGLIFAATIAFGLIVGPIGLGGLATVIGLAVVAIGLLLFFGGEKAIVDYKDDMPNKAVVERLDNLL